MTSHQLHTCTTEKQIKELLIRDGNDPSLSSNLISQYNLKVDKIEMKIEGDAYFGGNHEHHHHHSECCENRQQSVPKKEPKSKEPSKTEGSLAFNLLWWSTSAVALAAVAVVALPVAGAGVGVYVVYKVMTSNTKALARYSADEVELEQTAQIESATVEFHVSEWDKKQLEHQKHQLEMLEMKKQQSEIALSIDAQRAVSEQYFGKKEPKKVQEPFVDVEVI